MVLSQAHSRFVTAGARKAGLGRRPSPEERSQTPSVKVVLSSARRGGVNAGGVSGTRCNHNGNPRGEQVGETKNLLVSPTFSIKRVWKGVATVGGIRRLKKHEGPWSVVVMSLVLLPLL